MGLGLLGVGVWSLFLAWLPHAQPREVEIAAAEPADTEVTAYIASYLLPILAAASPSTGDIVAYAISAYSSSSSPSRLTWAPSIQSSTCSDYV